MTGSKNRHRLRANTLVTQEEEHHFRKSKGKASSQKICKDMNFSGELQRKERKMEAVFKKKLHPKWFQELSTRQMEAADGLYVAVRDDFDEKNLNRVRKVLTNIGLSPLPMKTVLNEAVARSRGSDVAFLWFVHELIFKTDKDYLSENYEYSLNERILYSCLCHLDMASTLWALDVILPPNESIAAERIIIQSSQVKHFNHLSPYLKPLFKPVIRKKQPLPPPLPRHPGFKPYEHYKDVNFTIKNQKTRWFCFNEQPRALKIKVNSSHNSGHAIAGSCLAELINSVVDNYTLLPKEESSQANSECRCYEDDDNDLRKKVNQQLDEEVARIKVKFAAEVEKYETPTIAKTVLEQIIHESNRPEMKNKNSRFEYGHDGVPTKKFFQRPSQHNSYGFNYSKIFQEDIEPLATIQRLIRAELQPNKESDCCTDEAIELCLLDMWQNELKMWNERKPVDELKEDAEVEELECESFEPRLDPYNSKQMDTLLRTGLKKIGIENSKLVIPFLPNSHKLPLLREWIRVRYGFKHSQKAALKRSKSFWKLLIDKNRSIPIQVPRSKDICCKLKTNWDQKLVLEKNTKTCLAKFYRGLTHKHILENNKLWATMEPYHCGGRDTRNVFYAYLPANENEMHPFRPWQTHEFLNMK